MTAAFQGHASSWFEDEIIVVAKNKVAHQMLGRSLK